MSAGRRLPSPHCFLREAERESQPGRSAQAALDAEEGGREKKKKKTEKDFFFFFSTCDKSCSHMGGTRPSYLTKGWLWWSQWSIQSGGVTLYSRQQEESLSQWDCEEISSTALYNSFLGVSFLIPVSLNICSALILQAQWSANSNKQ